MRDRAERHREADVLGHEFDLDLAEPDFAGERMVAAIAALRGIAERQQEAFVGARQVLQAQVAIGRKAQRLAREVADRRVGIDSRRGFDQTVAAENVGDARHRRRSGIRRRRLFGRRILGQLRIEQPMGVVEGRPEDLAARNILEGRGDPPANLHRAGVDRLGGAEPRQGGAKGAHQEDRLDHVAARLLDRQRRQFAVIQRAFGHDPIDAEAQLFGDLRQRHFRNVAIAAALMRQQPMGVLDGALASLDGDIHRYSPSSATSRVVRGIATTASSATSTTSTPRGNSVALIASRANRSSGAIVACNTAVPSMPGPRQFERQPFAQALDLQDQRGRPIGIFVGAEREAIERGKLGGIADQRETRRSRNR